MGGVSVISNSNTRFKRLDCVWSFADASEALAAAVPLAETSFRSFTT